MSTTSMALTKSYLHVPRKIPFTCLTMGQQFYQTVEIVPDKEMYVFYTDDERITFRQMKDQSQQFAAFLLSMGMKKGDRMAFFGANHSEWLVGLYACMQLGIIPVPFFLDFSISTIAIMMRKLQVKGMLLTRSPTDLANKVYQLFPELRDKSNNGFNSFPDMEFIVHGNLLSAEDDQRRNVYNMNDVKRLATQANVDKVDEICLSTCIDMDYPCSIYFTSGTTGLPKPTVLSHHAMVNCVADTGAYRQGINDFNDNWDSVRFGVTMPFAGSTSYSPIFLPASRGCTSIVLYPAFDAQTMAKAFQEERVTDVILFINHISALLNLSNFDEYDFSSLRIACLSGSTMPLELRQRASKLAKYITNMFGMTETMDNIANHPLDPPDVLEDGALFPYAGHEIKIVNDAGSIVPVKSKGELLIRGYPLFKYYWGEEEKTKAMKDENGWLHTGDIAEMDERGFIRIRGRKKELIIKNAVNLAPAELETVLGNHPAINSVLVIGIPDDMSGEEVCACIRMEKGKIVTDTEIVEFCTGKVHALLVPKYVVFVDDFPITDTGKFSRKDMTKRVLGILSGKQHAGNYNTINRKPERRFMQREY